MIPFELTVPQLVESNTWVMLACGRPVTGCVNTTEGEPSLNVMVYMVPGVLVTPSEFTYDKGNVSELPVQIPVIPGLVIPTTGLVPTNML